MNDKDKNYFYVSLRVDCPISNYTKWGVTFMSFYL